MFSEDQFKSIENQVVDFSNKMINAKALVMHKL